MDWISICDGLPDYGEEVFLCHSAKRPEVEIGKRTKTDKNGEHFEDRNYEPIYDVTHWAKINLPQGEATDD